MEEEIVTRYAPSPTGKFHIGGARTALFNYLYAKANNGIFILRIEDTDLERNQVGKEDEQINNLIWLGIVPDLLPGSQDRREPFRQSDRLNIYNEYANYLLTKNIAYKCFCTPEELEKSREEQLARGIVSPQYNKKCLLHPPKDTEGKKYAIRLNVPNDLVFEWEDKVKGKVSVPSSSIGDWIIIKSDGIPTYNFANVIDDHKMGISHVMRGEEHLTNTARQIHLYQIFGWKIPTFIHLTIITNNLGKKLSKRDETIQQFIEKYKEKGYLPEAIFNYLVFLGWSPKNEREIYSKDELIKIFNLEGFSKSPSQFDQKKLMWMNNQYIQKLSKEDLYNFLIKFIDKEQTKLSENDLMNIFLTFQSQIYEGEEIEGLINLFAKKITADQNSKTIFESNKILIDTFYKQIVENEIWSENIIKNILDKIGASLNLKGRNLMYPIRYILTNKDSGPSLVKIIYIFGKEKVIEILEQVGCGK